MRFYLTKPDDYVSNPGKVFNDLKFEEVFPYTDVICQFVPDFAWLCDIGELPMSLIPIHTKYGDTLASNLPMGVKVLIASLFAHDFGIDFIFDLGLMGNNICEEFYNRLKESPYVGVYSESVLGIPTLSGIVGTAELEVHE